VSPLCTSCCHRRSTLPRLTLSLSEIVQAEQTLPPNKDSALVDIRYVFTHVCLTPQLTTASVASSPPIFGRRAPRDHPSRAKPGVPSAKPIKLQGTSAPKDQKSAAPKPSGSGLTTGSAKSSQLPSVGTTPTSPQKATQKGTQKTSNA
jgi:hypothetical protein